MGGSEAEDANLHCLHRDDGSRGTRFTQGIRPSGSKDRVEALGGQMRVLESTRKRDFRIYSSSIRDGNQT